MTRLAPIVILVLLVIVFANAAFVVNEWEQVIITQFGQPVRDPIVTPGLKFKIPFIQKLHRFDRRFLEWEGAVAELPTKDKVFILVDGYARWRISDPLLFFQRLRNEMGAQSRLDDILDGETRNAIAKHELLQVTRSTNRVPEVDEAMPELKGHLEEISEGREDIRQQVLEAGQARTSDLGIEVLDVQFKRINYGEQVLQDVYQRMTSERRRIAERFRSEGQGEKAGILGDMDRELKRIQSEAYREAEGIRGRADAEATDIYAKAYNQSADARSFYEFLKTMETFEATVDPETLLLLSTDGDFYRYLKGS
ncbi:MAG: protease modulator HflC, partial [Thermoanaerobaculia bacterium]